MRSDPQLANYSVRIREVILSIVVLLVFLFFMVPRFFEEVQASDANDDFVKIIGYFGLLISFKKTFSDSLI